MSIFKTFQIIIGERYGYGFSLNGDSGYDYPTGGSGFVQIVFLDFSICLTFRMIFTRSAVESLLAQCPSCIANTDPDDMTIGICALTAGIPIVHESRLHQARPLDYAPEYIKYPISFHKFTDIDPISVYYEYLVELEEYNHKSEL